MLVKEQDIFTGHAQLLRESLFPIPSGPAPPELPFRFRLTLIPKTHLRLKRQLHMSGKAHREAILRACVGKSAGPHPDGPHPLFHRSRCGQADPPPWDFHFIGPHPSGGRGYVPASGQAGCRDAPRVQKKQLGFPDAQDAPPIHHRRFFT